jgi:hypothetical protein
VRITLIIIYFRKLVGLAAGRWAAGGIQFWFILAAA